MREPCDASHLWLRVTTDGKAALESFMFRFLSSILYVVDSLRRSTRTTTHSPSIALMCGSSWACFCPTIHLKPVTVLATFLGIWDRAASPTKTSLSVKATMVGVALRPWWLAMTSGRPWCQTPTLQCVLPRSTPTATGMVAKNGKYLHARAAESGEQQGMGETQTEIFCNARVQLKREACPR